MKSAQQNEKRSRVNCKTELGDYVIVFDRILHFYVTIFTDKNIKIVAT